MLYLESHQIGKKLRMSTGLKNDLYSVSPPKLWYLAALIQSSKNKWKTMLDIAQKAKQ